MKYGEQELWSYLDQCGIEFRSNKKALVEKYGSYPHLESSNFEFCEIGFRNPFVEGIAQKFGFIFRTNSYFSEFPGDFQGIVSISDDSSVNFNHVVSQLSKLFGEGWDSSNANTKGREWNFGLAKVTATIFPYDLQRQVFKQHELAQIERRDECFIRINSAYCPSPTSAELTALSNFKSIANSNLPHRQSEFIEIKKPAGINYTRTWLSPLSRRVDEKLPCDLGVDKHLNYLIFIDESKIVHFVPTNLIQEIQYTQMLPAKGRGGVMIWVRYQLSDSAISNNLVVLNTAYEKSAFRPLAEALSKTLSVKLIEHTQDDI